MATGSAEGPEVRRARWAGHKDQHERRERHREPRRPERLPEESEAGPHHPVEERRLGEVRTAVDGRGEPVAAVVHLARRLEVEPLVGVRSPRGTPEPREEHRRHDEQRDGPRHGGCHR